VCSIGFFDAPNDKPTQAKEGSSMFAIFRQRPVWVYAGAFVLFALCAFAYYMATGKGFVFFVLTAPWGFFFPASLTESAAWETWVYPVSWALIVVNSALFGALIHAAFRKTKPKAETAASFRKPVQAASGRERST
jgi:hypothetical protein